jgi:tol-pal system protein YbgF
VRNPFIVLTLAGIVGCTSLTPTNDPIYLRIQDLEARLIRMERVLENDSLIELVGDIRSLRSEVQTLLGDVETLRFELDSQAERQSDLFVNLDQRLSDIEAAQARVASLPSGPTFGGAPAAAVSDQQAYDAAFALIQQQDYATAQTAFEGFLASYPASALRGNAQYWLAEMHYAQLDFQTALAEFQRVLDAYPQSSKTADALLKIGYSNIELGNANAARQALQRVMREFPDTSAANLAQQRLGQLNR